MTNRILITLAMALPAIGLAQPNPQSVQVRQAARSVFRALDANSDQQLSYDEVTRATERLNALDADDDGRLSEAEMGGGGPTSLRGQAIIRVMDEDGDSSLSPDEIERASAALKRLDRDGDWTLGPQDLNSRVRNPEAPEGPPAAGGRRAPANPAPVAKLTGDILPGHDLRAFDGYTLIHEASYAKETYLARRILLADKNGKIVHEWPVEPYRQPEAAVAYLLDNGLLLRTVSKRDWLDPAIYPVGATGTVQLVDWDGKIVWEFDLDVAGKHVFHHDVDYNAKLDQIVLSSPTFGELWIIDHSLTMAEAATGEGDFLYRFGNPATTKSGALDDAVLHWQHDVHWVEDGLNGAGNILVFNNGNHRRMDGTYFLHQPRGGFGTAYSDLLELELPVRVDGSYDWTKQPKVAWSWNSDGSEDYYSPFMCGVTRLPNGNTIFVSSFEKRIIEVTEDGERVEDYRVPRNGRMYRVYKYPKDYPGLKGRL
jgi:hypothetical protein